MEEKKQERQARLKEQRLAREQKRREQQQRKAERRDQGNETQGVKQTEERGVIPKSNRSPSSPLVNGYNGMCVKGMECSGMCLHKAGN